MAAPTIDNIVLPKGTVLVLKDKAGSTTGRIFRHSEMGGARFHDQNGGISSPATNTHLLFVRDMTTEVIVNGVEYLAMHQNAVVGLIPSE